METPPDNRYPDQETSVDSLQVSESRNVGGKYHAGDKYPIRGESPVPKMAKFPTRRRTLDATSGKSDDKTLIR